MNYSKLFKLIKNILLCFLIVYSPIDAAAASNVKVAAVQYRAIPDGKLKNISNLERMVTIAANNGAKIIVLPEMCTTGLVIEGKGEARCLAETIPGQTTNRFSIESKKYGSYIIFGMPEYDPNNKRYYNSQILVGPDGNILAKYRKVHLYGIDFEWADKGDLGYQVVQTPFGRIGLGICYDINFSELLDFLGSQKVDIFAFSTNWVSSHLPLQYWSSLLKGRNMYFIAANNWGRDNRLRFSGGSIILSPDLTVLDKATLSKNSILYANITIR